MSRPQRHGRDETVAKLAEMGMRVHCLGLGRHPRRPCQGGVVVPEAVDAREVCHAISARRYTYSASILCIRMAEPSCRSTRQGYRHALPPRRGFHAVARHHRRRCRSVPRYLGQVYEVPACEGGSLPIEHHRQVREVLSSRCQAGLADHQGALTRRGSTRRQVRDVAVRAEQAPDDLCREARAEAART